MNKKLLAVDLDGTTFDDHQIICRENIEAFSKMLDEGHILVVDTGRPTHVMKNLLKEYKIFERENVYLLGFQGTVCLRAHDDRLMFGHYLDNGCAITILEAALKAGQSAIAFEFGKIYSFAMDSNVKRYAALSKEEIVIIDSAEELRGHNLTKVMVINFDEPQTLFGFQETNESAVEGHLISMFSNVAFLEYISEGFSKGAGLKELAGMLGFPRENIVACGDERNDISMIEYANIGAAVSNAREELKEKADYITLKDNNNGAVAEVVYKFIL